MVQLECPGYALVGDRVLLSFTVDACTAFRGAVIDVKVGSPGAVPRHCVMAGRWTPPGSADVQDWARLLLQMGRGLVGGRLGR